MSIALIGLGANLHDRAAALRVATSRLAALPEVRLVAASSLVETAAVGGPVGQPAFLNAALLVETTLPPSTIAGELVECEIALGRRRDLRWGPRTIDLDLLLFDNRVIESPELSVPHPRMAFRRFVLAPACEIAPMMLHPTSGWPLSRLLAHLDSGPNYVAVAGGDAAFRAQVVSEAATQATARVISISDQVPATPDADWLKWISAASIRLSREDWPNDEQPAISDFWLDEPVVTSAIAEGSGVAGAWLSSRSKTVPPKLVVWLDSESPPVDVSTSPPAAEDMTNGLARQPPSRRAFYRHVLAHDVGPTLRLEADDVGRCAAEIAAAIAAMRPSAVHP